MTNVWLNLVSFYLTFARQSFPFCKDKLAVLFMVVCDCFVQTSRAVLYLRPHSWQPSGHFRDTTTFTAQLEKRNSIFGTDQSTSADYRFATSAAKIRISVLKTFIEMNSIVNCQPKVILPHLHNLIVIQSLLNCPPQPNIFQSNINFLLALTPMLLRTLDANNNAAAKVS